MSSLKGSVLLICYQEQKRRLPPMRRKRSFNKLRMTTGEINTWLERSLHYGRDDGFVGWDFLDGVDWKDLLNGNAT
jgi:hypothetical protein